MIRVTLRGYAVYDCTTFEEVRDAVAYGQFKGAYVDVTYIPIVDPELSDNDNHVTQ